MTTQTVHSRAWFEQQVQEAKDDINQWPAWMREGLVVATASFPYVGDEEVEGSQSQNSKHVAKPSLMKS
jgi:hypothetical protein